MMLSKFISGNNFSVKNHHILISQFYIHILMEGLLYLFPVVLCINVFESGGFPNFFANNS